MNKINDGGAAFPMGIPEGAHYGHSSHKQLGMSLRHWFAGMALQGIACAITAARIDGKSYPDKDYAIQWAYEYADTAIAATKEDS